MANPAAHQNWTKRLSIIQNVSGRIKESRSKGMLKERRETKTRKDSKEVVM